MFTFTGKATAALVTLDFEEFSGVSSLPRPAAVSRGFVLDPGPRDTGAPDDSNDYHIVAPTDTAWFANNGTKYMVFDYFERSLLNIYAASDSVFGVKSLDLGEALVASLFNQGLTCSSYQNTRAPYEIAFTGYLAGGGTIARNETLDMICDGAGPQADFQTFTFNGQWNRLTMFSIQQLTMFDTPESNVGIDNIVLRTTRTVPEPGTGALLALGLGGLVFITRRKRSSTI
jgi:hypothetical protein